MGQENVWKINWQNSWIVIVCGLILSFLISPVHLVAYAFAAVFAIRARDWLAFAAAMILLVFPIILFLVVLAGQVGEPLL